MTSLLQNKSIDDAKSLLKKVVGNDKNKKKLVSYLLSQGLTEDEIATYLANPQSLTESQRSDFGRKLAQKKQLETGLDYLKKGAQVAATGYGGYQLYQMGSSLARSILGQGAQNSIAGSILGTNIAKNVINPIGGQAQAKPPPSPFQQATPENAENAVVPSTSPQQAIEKTEKQPSPIQPKEEKVEAPPEKKLSEYKKNLHADVNSSVIRKMEYDKKTHTLKVIFNNGSTYEYYDFPEEKFQNIAQGQATAKTKGQNKFGIWWVGKNPSAGAAFNEIIKPSLRRNGPYKYARVANTTFSPEEVEDMRQYIARALPMR